MFDLDFKVKQLKNVIFSHDELLEYYKEIEKKFQHLKWNPNAEIDKKTHAISKMYSWAIQSNLKDPTKPCPPYHIDSGEEVCENDDCRVPTEMIFGLAEKIIQQFPEVRQLGISGHPPGTRIDLHPDNDEFLKIHIPIKTNPLAWFYFEDEKFNLEEGKVYLINTTVLHGTLNNGPTDRIHLIFKFPLRLMNVILDKNYRL